MIRLPARGSSFSSDLNSIEQTTMPKFRPGQSGNPRGRPVGARDRRSALRELLSPSTPALVTKAIEIALTGDTAMMSMLLSRVIPPARSEVIRIELPEGLAEAGRQVVAAAANGEFSLDVARQLLELLRVQGQLIETDELASRIAALEQRRHDGSTTACAS